MIDSITILDETYKNRETRTAVVSIQTGRKIAASPLVLYILGWLSKREGY